jgi:hypothetical protein
MFRLRHSHHQAYLNCQTCTGCCTFKYEHLLFASIVKIYIKLVLKYWYLVDCNAPYNTIKHYSQILFALCCVVRYDLWVRWWLMSGVYCCGCCNQVFLGDRFVVLCVTSGGCVCRRMTSKMMLGFGVIFSFSWLLAVVLYKF